MDRAEADQMRKYIESYGWAREEVMKSPWKDAEVRLVFTGFYIDPQNPNGHVYGLSNAHFIQTTRNKNENEIPLAPEPVVEYDAVTIDNFHEKTGKRFRMTKEQKERNLSRNEAFGEFQQTYAYRKITE